MKPSKYKAMPGRPKKNRVKPPHEEPKATTRGTHELSRQKVDIACPVCKQPGHNKRLCKPMATNKAPVTDSPVVQTEVPATSKKASQPNDKGKAPVTDSSVVQTEVLVTSKKKQVNQKTRERLQLKGFIPNTEIKKGRRNLKYLRVRKKKG